MATFTILNIRFFLLIIIIEEIFADQAHVEVDLMNELSDRIPKHNPPIDVQQMSMSFDLKQILDTDEKNGIWTAKFTSWLIYSSQVFQWDPDKYNGTKFLNVMPGVLWSPDISKSTQANMPQTKSLEKILYVSIKPTLLHCLRKISKRYPFLKKTRKKDAIYLDL